MSIQVIYPLILCGLALALLLSAIWLKTETDDIPCTYRLFAARDALVRLVVEGKISRDNPHFDAIYQNINTLLRSSRVLSGPEGWPIAEVQGKMLAHKPRMAVKLQQPPRELMPAVLEPVAKDLAMALRHLIANHFGIWVQVDSNRRELMRIQKCHAKQFLETLPA